MIACRELNELPPSFVFQSHGIHSILKVNRTLAQIDVLLVH